MDPLTIIVSTLALLDGVSDAYTTIHKLVHLPEAFKEVSRQLPLAEELLKAAETVLRDNPSSNAPGSAADECLKDCKKKATTLRNIFDQLEDAARKTASSEQGHTPKMEWMTSRLGDAYRTGLLKFKRMAKANKVEKLMLGMMNKLGTLSDLQGFQTAIIWQDKLEAIQGSIEALVLVAEESPSIEDGELQEAGTGMQMNVHDQAKAYQNQIDSGGGSVSLQEGDHSISGNNTTVNHYKYAVHHYAPAPSPATGSKTGRTGDRFQPDRPTRGSIEDTGSLQAAPTTQDLTRSFSIAASAVKFIDFAIELLKGSVEVHGLTSRSTLILLREMTDDMKKEIDTHNKADSKFVISCRPFIRLCGKCVQISVELCRVISSNDSQDTLHIFRVQGNEWSISQISELCSIRNQMMLAALIHICDEGRLQQSKDPYRESDDTHVQQVLDVLPYENRLESGFWCDFQELISAFDNRGSGRMPIYRYIWTKFPDAELDPLPVTDARDLSVCNKIGDSLVSEVALGMREEAIRPIHPRTFGWIFEEPRKGDHGPLWSDFRTWLAGSSGEIYWITGKAGSGKSTLMKHVGKDAYMDRTRGYLRTWADDGLPLLSACFYFWNAAKGAEQNSITGLYRTILHQCISAQPSLAAKLFTRRYVIRRITETGSGLPEWSAEELLEGFTSLLKLAVQGKMFRLALFIDGLDEFDGKHKELIDLIKSANDSPGLKTAVKICVSSRPWNVFCDAFERVPSLTMDELNREDMEVYTRDRFHDESTGFRALMLEDPTKASQLKTDLINKAQGVFLWVYLVVQRLINEFEDGILIARIQEILEDLPKDLADLYERIWTGIPAEFEPARARYVKLREMASEVEDQLYLQHIWLADEPGSMKCPPDSAVKMATCMTRTRRRLNSRTLMLLDVYPGNRVDYLHRTGRDWILQSSRWERICSIASAAPLQFDAGLVLLKSHVELAPPTSSLLLRNKYVSLPIPDPRILLQLARNVEEEATDELFEAISHVGSHKPEGDEGWHVFCPRDGTKPEEEDLPNDELCFVILCARFNLKEYIQWRVGKDRKLVSCTRGKPTSHNILTGALVGLPNAPGDQKMTPRTDDPVKRRALIGYLTSVYSEEAKAATCSALQNCSHLLDDDAKSMLKSLGKVKSTEGQSKGQTGKIKEKLKAQTMKIARR